MDLAQLLVSSDGYEYILVVVDICTRFVFLEPLKNKTTQTVVEALFKLFCMIGFPKILQSDNGSEFAANKYLDAIKHKIKFHHRLTTPYHARANGVVERNARSVKGMLRKELQGRPDTWPDYLSMVQIFMNIRTVGLHKSTPLSLFYGRSFAGISDFSSAESHLMTEEQLKQRLEYLTKVVYTGVSARSNATQQKMVDDFNKSHRITELPPGSIVMAQEPETKSKLAPLFQGPFTVVSRSVTGSYVLRDTTDALLPRNYAASQLKRVTQALDSKDEYFELAAILGHKLSSGYLHSQVERQAVEYIGSNEQGKQPQKAEDLFKLLSTVLPEKRESIMTFNEHEHPKYNSELQYKDFHSDTIIRDYWAKLGLTNPHEVEKRKKRLAQAQKHADQIAKIIQKPVENLVSNKHGRNKNPRKSKNQRKKRM